MFCGRDVDVVEEPRVLQAELADLHADGVEDIAGPEHQFAQDHGALGLGVALDLDRLDVVLVALVDMILDVDVVRGSRFGLRIRRTSVSR